MFHIRSSRYTYTTFATATVTQKNDITGLFIDKLRCFNYPLGPTDANVNPHFTCLGPVFSLVFICVCVACLSLSACVDKCPVSNKSLLPQGCAESSPVDASRQKKCFMH